MARYSPSEMSRNHGDEEQFVRAHALLTVAQNLVLDSAKELHGYFLLTAPIKRLAKEIEKMADRIDDKYAKPRAEWFKNPR